MKGKQKILIVDDSEMNRSLLSDMLIDQFDIVEAENGLEASAVLQQHEQEFALVLLDIVMPVMDGFELLELMNQNGWIKSSPVIMISAETVPAYVDRAYDLGALDYINRPFDERTVRHRVISCIMLTEKQKELTYMVTEQMYENEKSNRLMIEILSNLVEFRNSESGLHVLHIQTITELLLDRLMSKTDRYDISEKDRRLISTAAALHDIGKMAVPDAILNKSGPLTPEEFEVMKHHAEDGEGILKKLPLWDQEPLIRYGAQICRWHHERYDGKGYPDGLKGEEIPIAAQVVALADVYDALVSRRVYKTPIAHKRAIEMICDGKCGVFNPLLLECLRDIADTLRRDLDRLSLERNSEAGVLRNIDQMIHTEGLQASERTLRLLEREQLKQHFFAELSQEFRFEYTEWPEVLHLSEWGSDYLGLPQTILLPSESDFGNQIFCTGDFADLLQRLRQTTPESPVVEAVYLLRIRGCETWCKVVARSMWSSEGRVRYEGAIGKVVDIHEAKKKTDQMQRMADLDPLTGLLNSQATQKRISALLNAKDDRHYVMIFFDLDNFKLANDKRGHLFGNQVLQEVADRLKKSVRSQDITCRVGGDEFLIFMEYQDAVLPQVDRIFHAISGDFQGFEIRISMGVAFAHECAGNYETLFHMADAAMYMAKYRTKNGYQFYSDAAEARLDLPMDRRHAVQPDDGTWREAE